MARRNKDYPETKSSNSFDFTLGPDVSAQVYKHLSEEEIEQLTLEISGGPES